MGSRNIYKTLFYLGALGAFFALSDLGRVKYLLAKGVTVESTVVELKKVEGDDGYTYKPVFKYEDLRQVEKRYESSVSSNPPVYQVGDRVPLVYDPTGKRRLRVKSFWGLHRGTLIFLSLALPLVIVGLGFILYDSRWNTYREY